MKQKVRDRFERMRLILKQDEQLVLDSLELDLRQTRTRLDQVLKDWTQHLDQVSKSISSTQTALSKSPGADSEVRLSMPTQSQNIVTECNCLLFSSLFLSLCLFSQGCV